MSPKNSFKKDFLPAIIMAVLSMLPIGLYILTIPYLFIEKIIRKQKFSEIGFKIKGFWEDIRKNWWLIILPAFAGLFWLFLSKFIIPEYFNHVIERTQPTLAFDKILVLITQLVILSLAEEISFRAFVQRKLSICIKPIWAILIASFCFAIGHFSADSPVVVVYDLTSVFIDSIIYGILFYRTKNVCLCWISHLLTNLVGVIILLVI